MSDIQENHSSYESDADVLLMLEFQSGDQASYENLMRKYYKRIFNFIYRLINDRQIAEDLTQDAFLRVYKSARAYRPKSQFQTWVYTIAKNLAFNELRRRKRPMVSLDENIISGKGDEMPRQMADDGASNAVDELVRQEQAEAVRQAIIKLPENQRAVVILYRYEKMSYEKIASAMDMSVSAIKSLLSRARENLRNSLADLMK